MFVSVSRCQPGLLLAGFCQPPPNSWFLGHQLPFEQLITTNRFKVINLKFSCSEEVVRGIGSKLLRYGFQLGVNDLVYYHIGATSNPLVAPKHQACFEKFSFTKGCWFSLVSAQAHLQMGLRNDCWQQELSFSWLATSLVLLILHCHFS